MIDLAGRYPDKKWIFFCDDDTYVFVSGLLAHLGKFNHDRDYYTPTQLPFIEFM